jgi:hypothetical protein
VKLFEVPAKFEFPTDFTLIARFFENAYEWACSFVFHWPPSIDVDELHRLLIELGELFTPEFAFQLSWLATIFDFSVDWMIPAVKFLFAVLVNLLSKCTWAFKTYLGWDEICCECFEGCVPVWRKYSCVVARDKCLDMYELPRKFTKLAEYLRDLGLSQKLTELGVFLDQLINKLGVCLELSHKSMFMVPRQSPEADSEHEGRDALVSTAMKARKDTVHVVMEMTPSTSFIFNPMTRGFFQKVEQEEKEEEGAGTESEDQQGPQPTGGVFELVHGIALKRFADKNVEVDDKGTYYLRSDKARPELISHKLVHRFNLADSSQPGATGKSSHDERFLVIDEAFICCFSYKNIACRDLQ